MQFRKYWKYLVCALLCVSYLTPANAAQAIDVNKTGHILVNNYPVEGAEISFFKVANVNPDGSYDWLPEFQTFRAQTTAGKLTDDNADPESLALYAETTASIEPETQTYISNGVAMAILPVGLYVMSSRPVTLEEERVKYHFSPTIVAVPRTDEGEPQYDFQVNAKYKMDEIPENPEMIHCVVIKGWEDEESGARVRPDEVVIDIYRDYEIEYKQTLNDGNNWQFEWQNQADGSLLYFIERDVSTGYRYRVEEDVKDNGDINYLVVNTFDEDLYAEGKGDDDSDAQRTPPPSETPPSGNGEGEGNGSTPPPGTQATPTPTPPGSGEGSGGGSTPPPGSRTGNGGGGGNSSPRTSDETNMTLPIVGLVAGGVAAIVIALRLRGSKDDE